jgi:DNA-binding CsgD family transcriptional regulator
MALWNVSVTPDKSGLPLFPSSAWPRLGMALRLSPREMQIVQGVFEDRKEESIAYELGISPHTVNTYFQRLYTKLRVSSRPQLMVRVMAEYLTMSGAQATDKYPTGRNEVGSVEHVYEEARHDWSTVS